MEKETLKNLRPSPIPDTVGSRIRYVREFYGLTQYEYSKRLGISQPEISNIESNKSSPSKTLKLLISHQFGFEVQWIETGTGNIHQPTVEMQIRITEELIEARDTLRDIGYCIDKYLFERFGIKR